MTVCVGERLIGPFQRGGVCFGGSRHPVEAACRLLEKHYSETTEVGTLGATKSAAEIFRGPLPKGPHFSTDNVVFAAELTFSDSGQIE